MRSGVERTETRPAFRTRWDLLAFMAVLTAGVLSYASTIRGEFLYDDITLIVNNDSIKSASRIPEILFSDLWSLVGRASNYYRPLPPLLYMLLYSAFGLRPEPFHIVNIALHAASAGLVFLLARDLLRLASVDHARAWLPPALAAGLLFAAHPVHAECVAWISGMVDASFLFFSLLALYGYIHSDGGAGGSLPYLVSLASLFLALLSKEPAVAVPILAVAHDLLFRRERLRSLGATARRWGPLLGVGAAYLVLRVIALGGLAPVRQEQAAGGTSTLGSLAVLLALYLRKLVVPLDLRVLYELQPVTSIVSIEFAKALALVAVFVCIAILAARRSRPAAFAILVVILPLAPALYLPAHAKGPAQAFAERHLYFPSVGLALLVSAALVDVAASAPRAYRAAMAATLAVVAVFGCLTITRNAVWRDSEALWSDCIRRSPNSAMAHQNLGLALLSRGKPDEGRGELRIAAQLEPGLAYDWLGRGILEARKGLFMQAVLDFQTALALRPDLVDAHYNLGVALQAKGWNDSAIDRYRLTLRLKPDHAEARNNLAILLAESGRLDEAIEQLKILLGTSPDDPQIRLNLAHAYELKGLRGQAEEQRRLAERAGARAPR